MPAKIDALDFFDLVPVALCVLDTDLRFVRVNARMAEFTGRPAAADIGHGIWEATPGVAAQFDVLLRRALAGESIQNVELVGTLPGTVCEGRTFLASAEPLRNVDGSVIGILCSAQDVTARRRAEQALRDSEEHYRNFHELSDRMPWTAEPDGRIRSVSPRYLAFTGLTEDRALGTGWTEAVLPDDLPDALRKWNAALKAIEPVQAEFRIRVPDGNYRWIKVYAAPQLDPEGRLQRWYGTLEDIHDRKEAEVRLRERDAYINSVTASITDCIQILDLEGRLLFMNEAGQRALEIDDLGPLLSNPWTDLLPLAERAHAQVAVQAAAEGNGSRITLFCPSRSGTPQWWDVSVDPILGHEGKPSRLIAISRDVTASRSFQEQIQRARSEERLAARKLEAVLESTTDSVLLLDRDWRVTYANGQVRRAIGPDVLHVGDVLWDKFPEEVEGVFYKSYQRAIQTGRAVSFEAPLTRSNVWLEVHAYPSEEGLSIFFRDVTQRRRSEQDRLQSQRQIEYLARHDQLTGLANRLAFNEHLDRLLASGKTAAIHYLDLDGFKFINDAFGHATGDALLAQAAKRICELARSTDLVARLGGDEFAILQANVDSRNQAASLAQRVLDGLSRHFDLGNQQLSVGVSIGISMSDDGKRSGGELLHAADIALYRAKSEGRATYRFFEPAMGKRLRQQHSIRNALTGALERQEFELSYQPIVSLEDGQIRSCEALLRWPRCSLGPIGPDVFIPAAEESGQIAAIGAWVLRKACQEAAQWPDGVRVAVNLSPAQFLDVNLLENIRGALEVSGLPPSRLELEITESLLINDHVINLEIFEQLRNSGIRIVLDDFGTGYSSLRYLLQLPFDKIKVDRSFVSGLPDRQESNVILQAVFGIGRSLGMTVVAEGVESVAQLHALRRKGYRAAQGYLFSPPIPASELRKLFGRSLTPALVA